MFVRLPVSSLIQVGFALQAGKVLPTWPDHAEVQLRGASLLQSQAMCGVESVPLVGPQTRLVVSTFDEDLSWLRFVDTPTTVYVHNRSGKVSHCSADCDKPKLAQAEWSERYLLSTKASRRYPLEFQIIPNRGDEAHAFLRHIIDNYDDLPEALVFVHGHRFSWHADFYMDLFLRSNCFDRREGYRSINKGPYFEKTSPCRVLVPPEPGANASLPQPSGEASPVEASVQAAVVASDPVRMEGLASPAVDVSAGVVDSVPNEPPPEAFSGDGVAAAEAESVPIESRVEEPHAEVNAVTSPAEVDAPFKGFASEPMEALNSAAASIVDALSRIQTTPMADVASGLEGPSSSASSIAAGPAAATNPPSVAVVAAATTPSDVVAVAAQGSVASIRDELYRKPPVAFALPPVPEQIQDLMAPVDSFMRWLELNAPQDEMAKVVADTQPSVSLLGTKGRLLEDDPDPAEFVTRLLTKHWSDVYEPYLGELPKEVCIDCCAQFAVTRDRIRRYPRSFYESLLSIVLAGDTTMEREWRMLFVCPDQIGVNNIGLKTRPFETC